MKSIVGFFLFLLPVLTNASFRIVGGREIEITDAPYIVRIYDPVQGGVCGGTILSERVVITAAHCINLTTAGQLLIRAGSKLLEKESTDVYRPRKLSVHTSWDRSIMAYDIALITVNKDFIFSDSVKKAELPAKDAPVEPGTVGKVSGWGTVDKGYPFPSNRLKQAEMTVLEQSVCEDELLWKRRKLSGETVFCAAGENYESSTCKGDSGGPFVVGDTLIGITSYGVACGSFRLPVAFTNVALFRDFIKEKTGIE